jgi:hypothetical protein
MIGGAGSRMLFFVSVKNLSSVTLLNTVAHPSSLGLRVLMMKPESRVPLHA